ncbi:MAG: PilZ domain-containing protein [Armatimonadetes bacterium]|nr:PilZ domain-containing protein [Armatimonadota bacterium]
MLGFLQRFFSVPEVRVVDYSEGMVTFRPRARLQPGTVTVRARVGNHVIRAVVRVERYMAAEKLHQGQLLGPVQARTLLQAAFPGDPAEEPDRVRRVLRVLSRQLPGFRASSVWISRDGVLLQADGEVPEGTELNLAVELDDNSHEPLRLVGVVRQCRPRQAHHLVEVELRGLEAGQQRQLDAYLESRRAIRQDPGLQIAG